MRICFGLTIAFNMLQRERGSQCHSAHHRECFSGAMGHRTEWGVISKGGNHIVTTYRDLVTSAAGFLSARLCDALLAQGHHAVG
jgi:hypothetical protein